MLCRTWINVRLLAFVLPLFSMGASAQVAKIAQVAKSGGDYTSPVDALTDIATWCGTPSASNRCQVKLAPGVYDLGSTPVVLPGNVDMRGEGPNLTTISGTVSLGLVRLQGDYISLADLTVVNDTSTSFADAVVVGGDSNFDSKTNTRFWKVNNVVARGMNGTNLSSGILLIDVDCDGGEIVNVFATGSGTSSRGLDFGCSDGNVTASNLVAVGDNFGVTKFGASSSLELRNSSFTGASSSIDQANGVVKAVSSELAGPVDAGVVCVGAYNAAGTALVDGTQGTGDGCDVPTP